VWEVQHQKEETTLDILATGLFQYQACSSSTFWFGYLRLDIAYLSSSVASLLRLTFVFDFICFVS